MSDCTVAKARMLNQLSRLLWGYLGGDTPEVVGHDEATPKPCAAQQELKIGEHKKYVPPEISKRFILRFISKLTCDI